MSRARGVAGLRHDIALRGLCGLCALASVAACIATPTAAFQLRGGVISSGAQHSSDGTHTLRGTAGQAVVGGSSGASFFVCHGFWCFGGARVVSVAWDPRGPGASPGVPLTLEFGPPVPNPTRGPVRFTLALPKDAVVTFEVVDVAGRRLGEASSQQLSAGRHELRWIAPAANAGVYFGLLSVDGEQPMKRRIVMVR